MSAAGSISRKPPGVDPPEENPFLFLEEEATWVAFSMADIREQYLNVLNGFRSVPEARGPSRDVPEPGPRGPLGFSPFYYFPFLFAGAFPSLSRDTLRTLCLSNRVLLEAILLQDRQIDESLPWTPEDLFLVDSYHHRAMEMLVSLVPPDHPFWTRTERCFIRYGRSVLREQFRHRHRLSPYSDQEFIATAAGKVALIQTTLHAMAALSGTRRHLAPLSASQTLFLVGFQAFDDLKDWKEDLKNRNFTHLLTRVLREGGFTGRVARAELPTVLEVGTVLYCRGIAAKQLLRAERFFKGALSLTRDAPVPLWKEVVRGFSKSCRDMRNDFAEIHRRAGSSSTAFVKRGYGFPETVTGDGSCSRPGREEAELCERIRHGLSFLQKSQAPGGGFQALSAACAYLSPAIRLPPSRGVTRLIHRSLAPIENIHPPLKSLLGRAALWMGASPGSSPPASGLPIFFERAFLHEIGTRETRTGREGAAAADRFIGLFWADRMYHASRRNTRLPRLENMAEQCIRTSNYIPWSRATSPGSDPGAGIPTACRPFLPLFLLLQAPGPFLFQPPLLAGVRDDLLARLRISGGYGNATDTALHMLCLLISGHQGDELDSGCEKLLHLQETDGSWAPNAFYKQGDRYFGSRELTTAWCLLALFMDARRPGCFTHTGSVKHSSPVPGLPGVVLQRGVPRSLQTRTERLLRRLKPVLPLPDNVQVTLGTWESMPAHFLLPHAERLLIGINLCRPRWPPLPFPIFPPLPGGTRSCNVYSGPYPLARAAHRPTREDLCPGSGPLSLPATLAGSGLPSNGRHVGPGRTLVPGTRTLSLVSNPGVPDPPGPEERPLPLAPPPDRNGSSARPDPCRGRSLPGTQALPGSGGNRSPDQTGDVRSPGCMQGEDPPGLSHPCGRGAEKTFPFQEVIS